MADAAWARGDRAALEWLLSVEGSYGRVSEGWVIQQSTWPWREGEKLSREPNMGLNPRTLGS